MRAGRLPGRRRATQRQVSQERRGRRGDGRLLENMNAGRQRTLHVLIQMRPLKAAQRISEYKKWPYRERAEHYENGYS